MTEIIRAGFETILLSRSWEKAEDFCWAVFSLDPKKAENPIKIKNNAIISKPNPTNKRNGFLGGDFV